MIQQSFSAKEISDKAKAAFHQAAIDVIERARRTGTPVVISEDGRIQKVDPDEMARRLGILSDLPPNAPVK